MHPTWTLDVLPVGAENRIALSGGHAQSTGAAVRAAVDALVRVAAALGTAGRQEYRLSVAGNEMIVVPGLTHEGLVDLGSLAAIAYRWQPTGADATQNGP